jgi:hypothetical protein
MLLKLITITGTTKKIIENNCKISEGVFTSRGVILATKKIKENWRGTQLRFRTETLSPGDCLISAKTENINIAQ